MPPPLPSRKSGGGDRGKQVRSLQGFTERVIAMDERIARIIRNIGSFEELATFERNAEQRGALDQDVRQAIKVRSAEFGRTLIAERTGLDLTDLSPAEEKIVQAVSEYVGVMKREGKDATRTFIQLRNRGLIDSAEAAVAKTKPTQGFQTLVDADLVDLSYEQIIVDNPDEFSPRAQWYARRTLGLVNESPKPPASSITPVQRRTEHLWSWLQERSEVNGGRLPPHTNAEAAAVLGMEDMHQFGRVFGNIQSRIDFACYLAGLPPLGLVADEPFAMAWNQQDRTWAFPIETMQTAARARVWTEQDFEAIREQTEGLPGQAYLSWKQELSAHEATVRDWSFGLHVVSGEVSGADMPVDERTRNPDWSREELILALDLYLRFRKAPPSKKSPEVAELSALLRRMAQAAGVSVSNTFRNANGVYMKLMNFRSVDPEYTADGKVGLSSGNNLERVVWNEFAERPAERAAEVAAIRAGVAAESAPVAATTRDDAPYWVFVCNPKKWAIDRFFDRGIERDTWGIRPADRDRFAPGQLGIVRVGVDQRSAAERNGKPPLEAGIYALCEVESAAFEGTGASDEYWAPGTGREPGWPTVNIHYLRIYAANPLTIERLRAQRPDLSKLLLHGFQAASFPIAARDFHAVMELLGEDLDALSGTGGEENVAANELAALERKYLNASPEVKTRVSKCIERGPVGYAVKRTNGFKCQVCDQSASSRRTASPISRPIT
jgi:predicted HNH restriction endonuclease